MSGRTWSVPYKLVPEQLFATLYTRRQRGQDPPMADRGGCVLEALGRRRRGRLRWSFEVHCVLGAVDCWICWGVVEGDGGLYGFICIELDGKANMVERRQRRWRELEVEANTDGWIGGFGGEMDERRGHRGELSWNSGICFGRSSSAIVSACLDICLAHTQFFWWFDGHSLDTLGIFSIIGLYLVVWFSLRDYDSK